MMPYIDPAAFRRSVNRRTFLGNSAYGLGGLALAGLLGPRAAAGGDTPAGGQGPWRGVVNPTHFPVKARRIIHLCMAGGPSQFESFDWKPELKRLDGQPFPVKLDGTAVLVI